MDSIGHILKTTRERKRISLSYAAAQTRVKIQYLELMERDDFSHLPAPAYAKGFLRMYATFLGLDPQPLVQQYVEIHLGARPPRLSSALPASGPSAPSRPAPATPVPPSPRPLSEPGPEVVPVPPSEPAAPNPGSAVARPFKKPDLSRIKAGVANWPWRMTAMVVAAVVVVVVLANTLARCARRAEAVPVNARPAVFKKGVPAVIQDVPEPYLPMPADTTEKPK